MKIFVQSEHSPGFFYDWILEGGFQTGVEDVVAVIS